MFEEITKQLSGLPTIAFTAVVGAFCAAYIPLLQRARRTQQEVELGLKELERIEKSLNVAVKLKADHGVQTDISRVTARLCLVIADMASDEEKSVAMIEEYVAATSTFRSSVFLTRLPPIRSPHWLSLTIRFLRILPLAIPLVILIFYILARAESNFTKYPTAHFMLQAPFSSLVVWINRFYLGKFTYDTDHLPELVNILLSAHTQTSFLLIIDLVSYYLTWIIISRWIGHSVLLSYMRRRPELFSSKD